MAFAFLNGLRLSKMRTRPRSRADKSDGHIIISGTGRAGTTLLVQYFTALGFDTGFSAHDGIAAKDRISHAGLEHVLDRNMPYVSKSPWFSENIGEWMDRGDIKLKCCLIPMRNLFAAAESRRRVYRESELAGLDPLMQPGSIWQTKNPQEQEARLLEQFYKLAEAMAARGVPVFLLHFPEFSLEPKLAFKALRPLLEEHGVTDDDSRAAMLSVVEPSLIHEF